MAEEPEFILLAQHSKILRIDLRDLTRQEPLPIPSLKNVFAIEYDLVNNCVFWADSLDDKISRLCMDGKSQPEVQSISIITIHSKLTSIYVMI